MRRFPFVLCCLAVVLSGCPFYLPIAEFGVSTTRGDLPLRVEFTDKSLDGGQPISHWRWDFGDGNTSTAINPVHTYTERGTYTVRLIVETPWGQSEKVREDLIEVRQIVRFPDAKLDAALRGALDIPVAGIRVDDLERLTEFDATGSEIANLAGLEYAVNLRTLILESNNIADISVLDPMRSLRQLNLRDNDIADISVLAALFRLESIDLGINRVSDITALTELRHLAHLNLERNPDLTSVLPLRNKRSLRELSLAFTGLAQSPELDSLGSLSLLTELTYLDLAANAIGDLSALSELAGLQTLILFDCQIENLAPLAGLTNLRELQLSNNGIQDITPLSGLTSLAILTLQLNQIEDLAPLVANTGIGFNDVIRLDGNPLSETSLCSAIPTLEARGAAIEVDVACPGDSREWH